MSLDEPTNTNDQEDDNQAQGNPEPASIPSGWPGEISTCLRHLTMRGPSTAAALARPRRALGLAAAAVAGTLIVGGAGAGIGIAWDNSRTADTETTSASGAA